jgi:hypothetical protein
VSSIVIVCPCGTEFETKQHRIDAGRGKYCSKRCMYQYMKRPSGLKYDIVKENPAWLKPGHETWNKGMRGIHFSPETEFKPGEHRSPDTEFIPNTVAGENNFRWSGGPGSRKMDLDGYTELHYQLGKRRGKASEYVCAHADETCKGSLQWANISQEYRDIEDFMPLCRSHHVRYDGGQCALFVYWGSGVHRLGPGEKPGSAK